jgi:hypothetical protein
MEQWAENFTATGKVQEPLTSQYTSEASEGRLIDWLVKFSQINPAASAASLTCLAVRTIFLDIVMRALKETVRR